MPQRVVQYAVLLFALLFSGCSLSQIIVLHDPLSAEEHVKLGDIYDSQGKTGLAREQYRFAVRQDPKNGRAWSLLGDIAYREKDYPDAEKAYGKAGDLDPTNGDLLNNLAWVYVQQDKRLGKAQDLVRAALERTPAHRPYYLDTLGVILLKEGKIPDAIAALKESSVTLPQDQTEFLAEAYRHLADAYTAAGDEQSAIEAMQKLKLLNKKK
jgi:Tfp pilus assembly protein PilF